MRIGRVATRTRARCSDGYGRTNLKRFPALNRSVNFPLLWPATAYDERLALRQCASFSLCHCHAQDSPFTRRACDWTGNHQKATGVGHERYSVNCVYDYSCHGDGCGRDSNERKGDNRCEPMHVRVAAASKHGDPLLCLLIQLPCTCRRSVILP